MQCPDCKQLRHEGPCDPFYEDGPDELEMLRLDAEMARERYLSRALEEKHHERRC